MPFDLNTTIAVKQREDGLLERDSFDITTSQPVNDSLVISAPKPPQEIKSKPNWVLSTLDEGGRQLQDLLTMPARMLGTEAPPLSSELATETIPSIYKYLAEKEISGYSALAQEKDLTPEQKQAAQPAPNRPGMFEIAEERPRWENLAEKGANLVLLGYGIKQGYNFIKNEFQIRDLVRKVNVAANTMADEVLAYTPMPTRFKVEGVVTQQQAGWLQERARVVEGFKAQIVNKLTAFEKVGDKWQPVAEGLKNKNMVNLLWNELRAMGEVGQASLRRPTIGDVVSFANPKGELLTGIIRSITGQRAEIDMAGKMVVATLSQLSLAEAPKASILPIQAQPGEVIAPKAEPNPIPLAIRLKDGTVIADETAVLHSDIVSNKNINPDEVKDVGIMGKEGYQATKAPDEKGGAPLENLPEVPKGVLDKAKGLISSKEPKPSVIPAKEVKRVIREQTGQIKVGDIIKESDALKRLFTREEQVSKLAYKKGQAGLKGSVETSNKLKNMFGQMVDEAQAEEDKLMVGAVKQFFKYEDDIAELEEQLRIADFNTEAEKVKAQGKLEKLKKEYTAAREERKQKRALYNEVKSLAQNIQAAPSENIAVEYQDMIEQLKAKFDLKRRTEKTKAKREGMRAFVERMKVEGKLIEIPKEKLAALEKVNLEDMTLDQLRQINDAVMNLEKLGKTKLKARGAVYAANKEKIKAELLKEAAPIKSKLLPEVPIGDKVNSWVERAVALQNYAQKAKVGLTPIDGLADVTGMTAMKEVLDADFSKYLTYNDESIQKWYGLTKDFTEKEFERIGVVAASRQEGGLERLANNGITEKQVNAIKLTPAEEKAYQFVLDTFDKEFPAVKQYSKEVYNADVGEQENYVSFMSDYDLMSDLEIYERFGQTPEQIATRKTKTVEQGFAKERAAVSKIKLETNIDKIFRRHMDDVAYMLNSGKNIKMYFEIVNSPEMREKLGDVGTLAWLQWLDLMARKGGTEGAKRIAALDILRQNIGAGVLAFRVSSVLVQFSSFADTIATIGTEWATKGASGIAISKEWRNFIMDNFPEIKKAVGDDIAFREFGEGFLANLARTGVKPLQVLDGLMRSTAACGSYQKLAAQKGVAIDLKNPDPELIAEATKLMRQSQGSSFFKDQPLAITAGYGLTDNKSLNKTILTFQSFMLNRWDNINRQIWRMGIKEKDYGKAISAAFWLFVVAGAVEEGIRRGSRKITQAFAKDKKEEDKFSGNVLLNIIQSMPLAGQLVSSITYSSNPVPVINTIEDLLEGSGNIAKGKSKETKLKGLIKAIGAVGSLVGVAGSSQAAQILRGRIPKDRGSRKAGR